MRRFHNLKSATKILLLFAALLFLTSVAGVASLFRLGNVYGGADNAHRARPSAQSVLVWKSDLQMFRQLELAHAMNPDEMSVNAYRSAVVDALTTIKRDQSAFYATLSEQDERVEYGKIVTLWARLLEEHVRFDAAEGSESARGLLSGPSAATYANLLGHIDRVVHLRQDDERAAADSVDQAYLGARFWIIGALGATVACGAALTWWVALAIGRPQAGGIWTGQPELDGALPAAEAPTELTHAIHGVGALLEQAADDAGSHAGRVAEAAAALAQQALAVQQVQQEASPLQPMARISSGARQNANHARQATWIVGVTGDSARHSLALAERVQDSIEAVDASLRKMAALIEVVDDIAQRTAELAQQALAGGRAVSPGSAFSSVAAEVRQLSRRATIAIDEIKALIAASAGHAQDGTRLARLASAALDQIVANVQGVREVVGGIQSASDEQLGGLREVNTAIAQMIAQNAVLVRQASAAAAAMQSQARALKLVVNEYRDGEAPAAPPPPREPAEVSHLRLVSNAHPMHQAGGRHDSRC